MMSMSTACVQDRFYPILANGNKSALHLTIKCTGRIEGGQFGYVFTEFDKIDEFVKESPRMAFAMPLDGDEFNVVRFTGKGAEEAISRMRSTAERSSKNPIRNTGTRDRKL
jgi:hypothetical protein